MNRSANWYSVAPVPFARVDEPILQYSDLDTVLLVLRERWQVELAATILGMVDFGCPS